MKIEWVELVNELQRYKKAFYSKGYNIKDLECPKELHLILGNEANGISEEVALLITKRVAVKNIGLKTESLNVAMATAIFLHEFCV